MEETAAPRAVVLDDNLMFAMLLEPALRRLGYRVRTTSGGPGFPDEVAAAPPDVLFVNLTSARYDGAALIRALRERPGLKRLPVVGYAGHVERHFFAAGRAAGADLVVPNSAVRRALPEVLEKLRRRREGAPEEEWPEE